jgi:hypothetical protein
MVTANLPLGTGQTLYSRTDDWFARVCLVLTILLMLRLGVSLLYAAQTRRRGAARRVKPPSGVVSVDVTRPEQQQQEPEQEIYRPPPRPRE